MTKLNIFYERPILFSVKLRLDSGEHCQHSPHHIAIDWFLLGVSAIVDKVDNNSKQISFKAPFRSLQLMIANAPSKSFTTFTTTFSLLRR